MILEWIPGDKIGEVIGPKGKIIREITEETGAEINVDDVEGRGQVLIYSSDADKAQMALDRIRAIANPVVPKAGERYYGTVVKTSDFGAFISLTPGNDGLLHISKLPKKDGKRLSHADEAVQVGDKFWVEVVEVRNGNKFSLDVVDGAAANGAAAVAADPVDAPAPAPSAPSAAAQPSGAATETVERVRERVRERTRDRAPEGRERVRGGEGADASGGNGDDEGAVRRRRRRRAE